MKNKKFVSTVILILLIIITPVYCYGADETTDLASAPKKLYFLPVIFLVNVRIIIFLVFRGSFNINLISAYWPFQFGIIYLANSIFLDRQLTLVGYWLLFTAFVSLFIPVPYLYVWLSLAGGGSLIFTGYVFRKQVLKID